MATIMRRGLTGYLDNELGVQYREQDPSGEALQYLLEFSYHDF